MTEEEKMVEVIGLVINDNKKLPITKINEICEIINEYYIEKQDQ